MQRVKVFRDDLLSCNKGNIDSDFDQMSCDSKYPFPYFVTKMYGGFSFELPHQGNSNMYAHHVLLRLSKNIVY